MKNIQVIKVQKNNCIIKSVPKQGHVIIYKYIPHLS